MEVKSLRVYADVMRRRSFAAVAREHELDPSSISRMVRALEDELGVRLFQRTTRRLAPTEAGAAYFERIAPLLEQLDEARSAAAEHGRGPSGLLRITASVSFGQLCLVPLLPAFSAAFPGLRLDLLLTDAQVDLVTEQIDLAIRLGPRLQDSSFVARELLKVRYRICASPGYLEQHGRPRQPADLARHSCLAFRLPGFRSRWILRQAGRKQHEVEIEARHLASSALALRDCARAGMGLAMLPHWIADADVAGDRLLDVFPRYQATATDFNTAAWLLYPSRAHLPLKVRSLIDYLQREFARRPPWLSAL